MFGYVVPEKGEMKIKEYELFRAYYCGVCKSMGKSFGPFCRLGLNYDSVFLGLFLSSINKERIDLKRESCAANPFNKKWIVKNSISVDFSADVNIILMYHKLKDDWDDEKNILAKLSKIVVTPGYRKASTRNKKAELLIKEFLNKLHKLESEKCKSIDAAADPFGQMLSGILSIGLSLDDIKYKKAIEWMGYNIGKWIYMIDAFDDVERDIKNNNYNPLLLQYDYNGEEAEDFKRKIKDKVKFSLVHTLAQAASAFELLDVNNKSIMENIIYLGMDRKTKSVLEGRSCNKDEKSL